jgi:hypothetical protein
MWKNLVYVSYSSSMARQLICGHGLFNTSPPGIPTTEILRARIVSTWNITAIGPELMFRVTWWRIVINKMTLKDIQIKTKLKSLDDTDCRYTYINAEF